MLKNSGNNLKVLKNLQLLAITTLLIAIFAIGCGKKETTEVVSEEPEITVNLAPTVTVTLTPSPTPTETPEATPEVTEDDILRFPAGACFAEIDLSSLTGEEAISLLTTHFNDYTLNVTLDDITFKMPSTDLGIEYNTDIDIASLIQAYIDDNTDFISECENTAFKIASKDVIKTNMIADYNIEAHGNSSWSDGLSLEDTYATICYNEDTKSFVPTDGVDYIVYDYSEAADLVYEAAASLEENVTVKSSQTTTKAELAADKPELIDLASQADEYLNASIKITFTFPDGVTDTESISKKRLASWISYNREEGKIVLDTEKISTYTSDLSTKYTASGTDTAKFMTTSGSYISLDATSGGVTVDSNQLYKDVYAAVKSKSKTTIEASITSETNESGVVDFDGNYCEIDLTNQMVYVYKDYELKVSSSCVTGCVNNGTITPTGVYEIWLIERDRYLTGVGYKSWVNFFLAFNGGIGFHDASWRSEFGGDIYLYSGSHGCVNMPYEKVKILYDNVKMGTKVIVYGGVESISSKKQEWSGTSSYNVTSSQDPFKLDMTAKDGAKLTYTSSDTSVCTVSDYGNVTPVNAGTATITINSSATGTYRASSTTVTIKVTASATQMVTGTDSLSLKVGKTGKLSMKATTKLSYSSENEKIATVSEDGTVTAVSAGSTYILVTATSTKDYESASKKVEIKVTTDPTQIPSPTVKPTSKPKLTNTPVPTKAPTKTPTKIPAVTSTPVPTKLVTPVPTDTPTITQAEVPTEIPTEVPQPTDTPVASVEAAELNDDNQ